MCPRCYADPVASYQVRNTGFCECKPPRPTPGTENVCCLNCGRAIQTETSSCCECDDPDQEAGGGIPCCKTCGKVVKSVSSYCKCDVPFLTDDRTFCRRCGKAIKEPELQAVRTGGES